MFNRFRDEREKGNGLVVGALDLIKDEVLRWKKRKHVCIVRGESKKKVRDYREE